MAIDYNAIFGAIINAVQNDTKSNILSTPSVLTLDNQEAKLLVGQEILHGTPVAEAGRGWSFAPVPDTWVSTQWLSEVLFARLNDVGGLAAFPVFRTVTAGLSRLVLAGVTLGRRPVRAGVWAFTTSDNPR